MIRMDKVRKFMRHHIFCAAFGNLNKLSGKGQHAAHRLAASPPRHHAADADLWPCHAQLFKFRIKAAAQRLNPLPAPLRQILLHHPLPAVFVRRLLLRYHKHPADRLHRFLRSQKHPQPIGFSAQVQNIPVRICPVPSGSHAVPRFLHALPTLHILQDKVRIFPQKSIDMAFRDPQVCRHAHLAVPVDPQIDPLHIFDLKIIFYRLSVQFNIFFQMVSSASCPYMRINAFFYTAEKTPIV